MHSPLRPSHTDPTHKEKQLSHPSALKMAAGAAAAQLTRRDTDRNELLRTIVWRAAWHWGCLTLPALARLVGNPNSRLLHQALAALCHEGVIQKIGFGKGPIGRHAVYAVRSEQRPKKYREHLKFLLYPGRKIVRNSPPSRQYKAWVERKNKGKVRFVQLHRLLVPGLASQVLKEIARSIPGAIAHSEFVLRTHFGWQNEDSFEENYTYVPDAVIATRRGIVRIEVETTIKSEKEYNKILPQMDRDWDDHSRDITIIFVVGLVVPPSLQKAVSGFSGRIYVIPVSDTMRWKRTMEALRTTLSAGSECSDPTVHDDFIYLTQYAPPIRKEGWTFPASIQRNNESAQ